MMKYLTYIFLLITSISFAQSNGYYEVIELVDSTTIPTPVANEVIRFFHTDGAQYVKDSNGDISFYWQKPIGVLVNNSVVTNSTTNGLNGVIISENVTIPTTGQYRAIVSGNYNVDAANSDIMLESTFNSLLIQTNPIGDNNILKEQVTNSSGIGRTTGSSQEYAFQRTFILDLTAGTYPFALNVYSETGGVEASF